MRVKLLKKLSKTYLLKIYYLLTNVVSKLISSSYTIQVIYKYKQYKKYKRKGYFY